MMHFVPERISLVLYGVQSVMPVWSCMTYYRRAGIMTRSQAQARVDPRYV